VANGDPPHPSEGHWWDDGPIGPLDPAQFDLPQQWYGIEETLFLDLVFDDPIIANDPYLQELFDTALFDPDVQGSMREDAYQAMSQYLWDEYGIDFDDVFDWEDYRDWYDAA
jgi:hypothetical protein